MVAVLPPAISKALLSRLAQTFTKQSGQGEAGPAVRPPCALTAVRHFVCQTWQDYADGHLPGARRGYRGL
jgi:hypothetical protein